MTVEEMRAALRKHCASCRVTEGGMCECVLDTWPTCDADALHAAEVVKAYGLIQTQHERESRKDHARITQEVRKPEVKTHMTREECLQRAGAATSGKRVEDYGKPEDNFGRIAGLWSAYLQIEIKPTDVAMMMSLLKIARVKGANGKPAPDCFVDLAGYAACAAEMN